MTAIEAFREMTVIAENHMYCLRILQSSDRENYLKTMRESVEIPELFEMEFYEDAAWKIAMNSEDALTIPIERTCDREYLGQFLLKQPDAHTIEVGLDLREKNRSRGIGTEVMRLLLTKLREQNTEDMVIARAYSDNVRSIRLIQKVGGVKIREEPSEYEAAKAIMHQISEEAGIEMPEGDADMSNRHILVYRLPC